ncbi:hypothetical protein A3D84_03265 [Candidatus Woesebacteria bacterium RIFCSPHIGHO2_02_FULL_42_20]|uniref:HD domain-containing protein n=1 Tax=Candidatus Woesebacteria bacterium RIFCSPHIGHO2_12_FULL_41_24 TaxID=1802510 RepID=A0A1F8AS84_9BACT|nr:MAG: hypothetical protein A2W15_03455 [Candidatus Woesebacteria bacterium RBG_16_41_13]OGM34861.1 MAG: hypothetical protein A3D84_03265 [Candidatus Woesebacteria bacterium RIFCSPHIGHO2_02_FULL_42_20]OGM54490.1 MAG: hypothetical protein A3E44_00300 [Candidatus Woesebacteria bacterium RIFCSPHIGHO2_12_FULL_41_24]OGM65734.1 MAG: hypothetical protein A2969_00700 [Candidatus Woesebacteria bacterium RIFCSPLOWO2_01_FULL_42_67]OGM71798.1 MAG: hypothetical protein A3I55_00625 [Candidatus Woesebacteria
MEKGLYPGYLITREGSLNLIFDTDEKLSLQKLETLWTKALAEIEEPPYDGYIESHQELYYKGKRVKSLEEGDDLGWFFAPLGTDELTREVVEGRWVRGIKPTDDFLQENVHVHSQDIELWVNRLHGKGLLPSEFNINKARLYTRLHDLGEALRGDHAALRGKKTAAQVGQEQSDFVKLIQGEIGGILDEQTAKYLIKAYQNYEGRADVEARVVLVFDRFCGSMVHIHSELKLTLDTLRFSYDRVFKPFEDFSNLAPMDYDPKGFKHLLERHFLPSGNWVRFYNFKPDIFKSSEEIVF